MQDCNDTKNFRQFKNIPHSFFIILRILLGLVFIGTGLVKAVSTPLTFTNGFVAGLFEGLLPLVEIAAGLILLNSFKLLKTNGPTVAYWLARIILGLIFVYSGVVKIAEAQLFVMAVENYRLLPDFLAPFMAVILPWVELVAGVILLGGVRALPAVTLINLMLLVFIAALSISYARGLNIDCGCFNVNITDSKHSLLEAIWRDLAFLTLGVWITIYLVPAKIKG